MNDPDPANFNYFIVFFVITITTALHAVHVHATAAPNTPIEIFKGFSVTPDLSIPSTAPAQTLLLDPTSDYALGFLRVGQSHLALAVIHLPSFVPVWTALPDRPASWSATTRLTFDGNLVLSDPTSVVSWSTNITASVADRIRLVAGDLQLLGRDGANSSVLWSSFDFPTDTLLVNQNFTGGMRLTSASGLYSMRTVDDYLGLFAQFKQGSEQLYYKHTVMQTRAEYVPGSGAIRARVDADGFIVLYQTGAVALDVIPFSTYHRGINATRRLRLESDGNLRAYFWNATAWALDYAAVQDRCGLPSECGAYGVCDADAGCSCLDGKTKFGSGIGGGCLQAEYGDFCGVDKDDYTVLRRGGVDLAYKRLLESERVASEKICEESCEGDCGCWGAIYTNLTGGSGMCYKLDFPVRTVVETGDQTKMGYFKMRKLKKKELAFGAGVFWGVVGGVGLAGAAVIAGVAYAGWRWRRWRRQNRLLGGERIEEGYDRDTDVKSREVELTKK